MQEVTLELPMFADMELTASKTARALGEQIRMSPDKIDEIRQAVIEACINAFEHSRAQDEKVRVVFKILGTHREPDGLQITVQDRGIGFAPGMLTPPDLKKKFGTGKRKRGWGLMIIKGLMDEVDIQSDEEGTRIVMRKMR